MNRPSVLEVSVGVVIVVILLTVLAGMIWVIP
jgi:hypothetical protein